MVDINYWEDRDGIVNEVSMDLNELMVMIDQGIAGNPSFFRELKLDVIERVRRYQLEQGEQDGSDE